MSMTTEGTETEAATEALGAALENQAKGAGDALAQNTGSAPKTEALGSETPPKESASSAYSAIAKERKKFLAVQKQLKDREQQLAEREKRIQEFEGKKTEKPRDPIAALQAAGFSYQDAVNFMLNQGEMTADMQVKGVRDELETYKKEQEEARRREAEERKERAEAEQTAQVEAFQEQIADFIGSNSESYELISQEDPGEVRGLIYNLIAQHYRDSQAKYEETGDPKDKPRILSIKEGTELAERYYEERLEKFINTKKIQSKFGQKGTENTPKGAENGSKTLANAMTASGASPNQAPRTEAERIERAMRVLDSLKS